MDAFFVRREPGVETEDQTENSNIFKCTDVSAMHLQSKRQTCFIARTENGCVERVNNISCTFVMLEENVFGMTCELF